MEKKEFKVMFIGDTGIGAKTSLIYYIINKSFYEFPYSTSCFIYYQKSINTSLGEVKLGLWDAPGQLKYYSLTEILFKDTDCFIIGFDLTRRCTFNKVDYFYKLIKEHMGDIPLLYLVGNKSDLFEKINIPEEEAEKYANERNIKYFEVSAKTGVNVNELINDVANSLIQKYIKENKQDIPKNIDKNKTKVKKKCLIF